MLEAFDQYVYSLLAGQSSEAYKNMAKSYLLKNEWLKARRLFEKVCHANWGTPWNIKPYTPYEAETISTGLHKLDHDIEQMEYLFASQLIPSEQVWMLNALNKVRETINQFPKEFLMYQLPPELHQLVQGFYDRNIWIEDVPAIAQALNPNLDIKTIQEQYFHQKPGLVYIDQLLSAEALEKIYQFCLKSTIWHDYHKGGGYVGTYMHSGFNCELLYQIAFELREAFPQILKGLPLTQMWSYKYDSERIGIETHADAAAVNINFWVTPDEANLSPTSGGLAVYGVEAPREWDFDKYNIATDKIHQFIRQSNTQRHIIPYRCNRAVMFNSNLFHETDHFHFKQGYENRRINITMLFGYR